MTTMKQWLLSASLAAAVFTAGCGGSGSSGSGSTPPPPDPTPTPTPTDVKVDGPLDAVQTPLSETVLAQLRDAVAGTPLEAIVASADQIIVQDLLDIVDALALGLQSAATSGNPAAIAGSATDVQVQVFQLVEHLRELLDVLAAGTGGAPGAGVGGNPLAGTPLEALGTALLPILSPASSLLDPANGTDLQLTQLAEVVALINQQLQAGLAQIPAEATSAPVVGGVFSTLSTTLTDVTALIGAAATYNGANTTAQIQNTVDNLLVNVLTEVLPLRFLEEQSGNPGALTGQIEGGVAQVSAVLGDGLGQVLTPVLEQLLGGALTPVLDPIENAVLPTVLTPIIDALSGGVPGGIGGGFGATELGSLLGVVGTVLAATPLGDLLGTILGPLLCLFEGTPLAFLCDALGS